MLLLVRKGVVRLLKVLLLLLRRRRRTLQSTRLKSTEILLRRSSSRYTARRRRRRNSRVGSGLGSGRRLELTLFVPSEILQERSTRLIRAKYAKNFAAGVVRDFLRVSGGGAVFVSQ